MAESNQHEQKAATLCLEKEREHFEGDKNIKGKPKNRLRRILIRIMLFIAIIILTPIISIWIYIAQPVIAVGPLSSLEVDAGKLEGHVRTLCEQYNPRNYQNQDNLNKCAEYIRAHFEKAGATTQMQEFTAWEESYQNVIGLFGDPSAERIVVGAHYDSCGNTPGADDNASAVAGLIELAYLIGHEKPGCTIELVAYSLEEPPFFGTQKMGSAHHAAWLKGQGVSVRGVIVLEMIGYFSDEPGSQSFPSPVMKLFYPGRGNFIAVVGRSDQRGIVKRVKKRMKGATDLPVCSICAPPIVEGIDFSDHRNYWPYGWPAVMITDTAFYRNHEYHQVEDTADRLDYDKMGKVVVGVFEAVKEMAKE